MSTEPYLIVIGEFWERRTWWDFRGCKAAKNVMLLENTGYIKWLLSTIINPGRYTETVQLLITIRKKRWKKRLISFY